MRTDDPCALGLSVSDLECTRGGRRVFARLGFELDAGRMVQVRGANGSGKSSLLRLLCGLAPPSRGEVRWRGRMVRAGDAGFAAEVAYLGHSNGLGAELSVLENLRFSTRVAGRPRSEPDCRAALARLRLAGREQEHVRRLSQGQKRRVALARVLLSERPLWLLDEPHAGLDADGERALADCLSAHLEQGGLAVVTTHHEMSGDWPPGHVLDMNGYADAGHLEPDRRA